MPIMSRFKFMVSTFFKSTKLASPILEMTSFFSSCFLSCSDSDKVPQEPHSKQRPLHLGNWASQLEHTKIVFILDILMLETRGNSKLIIFPKPHYQSTIRCLLLLNPRSFFVDK